MNGMVSIAPYSIAEIKQLTTSTTAQDVAVNGRCFIIQNNHASEPLYFKEKNGVAATTTNSWKLDAGATTFPPSFYLASTLSVCCGWRRNGNSYIPRVNGRAGVLPSRLTCGAEMKRIEIENRKVNISKEDDDNSC